MTGKEKIPTIDEVLDLMQDRMKEGLLLNIELKNSVVFYEGMEEKIVALIHKKGLEKYVVYSSFYTKSLDRIRRLEPEAFIGVLDVRVSDCFYKKRGHSEQMTKEPLCIRSKEKWISQKRDFRIRQ